MAKKPVLLCIMDGFGWVPEQTFGNAIAAAKKPNLDRLFETYPYTTIQASGMAVGLPEGQMGNSEVGHTNMGAGRIVYQQLTLITKSIMDGTMKENDVLVRNMRAAIDAGKAVHLMGLLGTGGVHSHIDHLFGLLDLAKHLGAKKIYVHCIMDGRDTDPHSGKGFIADLQKKLDEIGVGEIATVTGRYYAMDRDSNWDREEKAYAALVYGEGNHASSAMEAIEKSYADVFRRATRLCSSTSARIARARSPASLWMTISRASSAAMAASPCTMSAWRNMTRPCRMSRSPIRRWS